MLRAGDPVRPFILLQLSDLHFGEHSRFHGQDLPRLAKACATAIASAREDLGWQEPVGLLLVTGDLAEAARPKEYRAALEFFSALVGHLSLERSRVVFVPGNHDVSWTKCLEVQGLISDGELDEAQCTMERTTVQAPGRGVGRRTEKAPSGRLRVRRPERRPGSMCWCSNDGWIAPSWHGRLLHYFNSSEIRLGPSTRWLVRGPLWRRIKCSLLFQSFG